MTPALNAAIALLLEGVSRKELEQRAGRMSVSYRDGGTSAGITAPADALAYLVTRAPATYAAIRAVFDRVAEAMPEFSPKTLLDVGAGPGTAAWASRDAWPTLAAITLIEPNAAFRDLASRLMPDAHIVAGSLGVELPRAALVTAAYVLAELPEAAAAGTARELWSASSGMLVLVEPGTPGGFARIRAARAALIEAGGHVAAPCTHDNACPLQGDDWCHFSQRLARSRDHMIAKGAKVPFEDERYAYVAVSRVPVTRSASARVIKPPVDAKPGITLPLCEAGGLRNAFIAKREKEAFRVARKKEWGDLF
ncbi:MAG: small ribosomal subunit Rsm22 family protein [Pseudomonadota bacterium]